MNGPIYGDFKEVSTNGDDFWGILPIAATHYCGRYLPWIPEEILNLFLEGYAGYEVAKKVNVSAVLVGRGGGEIGEATVAIGLVPGTGEGGHENNELK